MGHNPNDYFSATLTPGMPMEPVPAPDWPSRPLTEPEAGDLLDDDVHGVWVMDHDAMTRAALGAAPDEVVDVVLEAGDGFRMFSYSEQHGDRKWLDYGTADEATIRGTLESYRLLAGETDTDLA